MEKDDDNVDEEEAASAEADTEGGAGCRLDA